MNHIFMHSTFKLDYKNINYRKHIICTLNLYIFKMLLNKFNGIVPIVYDLSLILEIINDIRKYKINII